MATTIDKDSFIPAEFILNLSKKEFEIVIKHFTNKIGSDDIYINLLNSKPNFVKKLREGCYKILAVKRANTNKVNLRYLAENELWLSNMDKELFEGDLSSDETVDKEKQNIFRTSSKQGALVFTLFYLLYNILYKREINKTLVGSEQNCLNKLKTAYSYIKTNSSLQRLLGKIDSYVLNSGYKSDVNCLKDLEYITSEDSFASDDDLNSIYNI